MLFPIQSTKSDGIASNSIHLTRRSTLRLLLGSMIGFVLNACQPQVAATVIPSATPAATSTAVAVQGFPQTAGIHQETLESTGQRFTIAVPNSYSSDQPVPLILALHYGGNVTPWYGRGVLEILVMPALRELEAIIVAPDANVGPWTSPQSEANLMELLDAIHANYNIDARKTLVTGFSMGGIGTWYIAGRNQDRFAAAIPIAGQPQADSVDLEWSTPLYVIHSREDEVIPIGPTESAVEQLKSKGVSVEFVVLDGISHFQTDRFAEPLRDAIPWIEEAWK